MTRRLSIPSEIAEQGASCVSTYLLHAEKQGMVWAQRETRLIILGSAGAGKTTLSRRLMGDMSYPELHESTHGVDTSNTLELNGIKTRIWDFGGQVIYHSSHRCFMSANCVYILVINARTEDNRDINRLNYWLDTIRIYSENKAKVFIIFNESDDRQLNVDDYDSIKSGEYASIIHSINSFNIGKDEISMAGYMNLLASYIESYGHQSFGQNDRDAMVVLNRMFHQHRQVLKNSEFESVLREAGILTRKDQLLAKELFRTLGIALSYDFMTGYVLDPYWISHGVYKVIDLVV